MTKRKLYHECLLVKSSFLITLITLTLTITACVTMSEGEKMRLRLEALAKENKACCIERGYVGIGGVILNDEKQIEIIHVIEDSPASKAGILQGDIILKIDNEEIKNKYQAFNIYNSKYPGDETSLTVKRKGQIITKNFKLTSLHVLNVVYALHELVYKDIPVRLAVITGQGNFDYAQYKQEFDKFETYFVGMLESSFIKAYRGHSNFIIIDRQKTDSVFNELKLQESGLVDNRDHGKLGNMLGATHLMIMDFSSQTPADNRPEFLITMRLIEVESGKNVATSPFKIKSQKQIDIVQLDLIDYLNNKMGKITHLEKDSLGKYKKISKYLTTKWDTNESLYIFSNEVIPIYEKYLGELQMITPKTDEVNTVHKLLINGASLQYEGFKDLEKSIIQRSATQFREANNKIREGMGKIKQYNENLNQLSTNHKVVLKKKNE